jgi:hypothetical protein
MLWFEAGAIKTQSLIQSMGVIVDTSGQLCERH